VIIDLDKENADSTGAFSAAATVQLMKTATGADCGDNFACLQSDGSGYFIINHKDLPPFPAWFTDYGMGWHESIIDTENRMEWQSWFLQGDQPWNMNHNLDWLAQAAIIKETPTATAKATTDAPADVTSGTITTISASLLAALSLLAYSNIA
jgi:hypothetical protein